MTFGWHLFENVGILGDRMKGKLELLKKEMILVDIGG